MERSRSAHWPGVLARVLPGDALDLHRQLAQNQPFQLDLATRVVDINADEISVTVVVQDDAFRDLATSTIKESVRSRGQSP